jgi:hypothetical protein
MTIAEISFSLAIVKSTAFAGLNEGCGRTFSEAVTIRYREGYMCSFNFARHALRR